MTIGHVALVGAGPGDPGLLTRRGEALLRAADAVLYDALIDAAILDLTPSHCERVFVGKRAGNHAMPQADIEAELIRRARAGQRVVRLKGGDPYLFGRGGEEALACLNAGVPVEVVPGVTSALAGPAAAGMPVTFRGMAASVLILHGQYTKGTDADELPPAPDWSAVARAADTLVFLMAVGSMATIRDGLLSGGRRVDEPVAAIHWAATPKQRTLRATVADFPEVFAAAGLQAPAIIVIGEVVALGDQLRGLVAGLAATPLDS